MSAPTHPGEQPRASGLDEEARRLGFGPLAFTVSDVRYYAVPEDTKACRDALTAWFRWLRDRGFIAAALYEDTVARGVELAGSVEAVRQRGVFDIVLGSMIAPRPGWQAPRSALPAPLVHIGILGGYVWGATDEEIEKFEAYAAPAPDLGSPAGQADAGPDQPVPHRISRAQMSAQIATEADVWARTLGLGGPPFDSASILDPATITARYYPIPEGGRGADRMNTWLARCGKNPRDYEARVRSITAPCPGHVTLLMAPSGAIARVDLLPDGSCLVRGEHLRDDRPNMTPSINDQASLIEYAVARRDAARKAEAEARKAEAREAAKLVAEADAAAGLRAVLRSAPALARGDLAAAAAPAEAAMRAIALGDAPAALAALADALLAAARATANA